MTHDELWKKIINTLKVGEILPPLYMSARSKKFQIVDIYPVNNPFVIKIQWIGGKESTLKLHQERFFSVYDLLKENPKQPIKIGASKTDPQEFTIENRLKMDYNENPNSTATATWICAILKHVFGDPIEFNGRGRNQKIRLVE